MVQKIIDILRKEKLKIATIESCTGGNLINELTNVSGSSEVVIGSYVVYSINQKVNVGVSKAIIDEFGVYSEQCALEMALACKRNTNADICIATTGRLEDFVNELYVCVLINDKSIIRHLVLPIEITETKRRIVKKMWVVGYVFSLLLETLNRSKVKNK